VYAQIAAECGIPALMFYVTGLFSTFLLFNKTFRQARRDPRHVQIAKATFCMMLAVVGYGASEAFLNMTYTFVFPALAGLSIAVANAAKREFSSTGKRSEEGAAIPAAAGQRPIVSRKRFQEPNRAGSRW
jgi:nitrate/nitrite transporter NarK